jgi:hypothetical protein
VVVEYGAIPRDATLAAGEWRDFTVADAAALLRDAGYAVGGRPS